MGGYGACQPVRHDLCFGYRVKITLFIGICVEKQQKNKVFIIIFLLVSVIQIYFIYYGGNVFRTYGLTLYEFAFVLTLAFTVIPVDLIRKIYLRKKNKHANENDNCNIRNSNFNVTV